MATPHQWTAEFFRDHPVFRTQQFLAAAPSTPATAHSLLRAHHASGRLTNVRRGLWAAHPAGGDHAVDPYAVAGVMAPDAIVALHAAMELHGFGASVHSVVTYFAAKPAPAFESFGTLVRGVKHPIRLVEQDLVELETSVVDRLGTKVRVTNIERTMVDMLDRQELSGGIEEIWRIAEQVGWLDDRRLLAYVRARRSAVLAARVGYLIEQHPQLQMPASVSADLLEMATTWSPGPFDLVPRHAGPTQYLHQWRLRVPVAVIERSWEEPLT